MNNLLDNIEFVSEHSWASTESCIPVHTDVNRLTLGDLMDSIKVKRAKHTTKRVIKKRSVK